MANAKKKPTRRTDERRIYVKDPLWMESRIAAIQMRISASEFTRRALKEKLERLKGSRVLVGNKPRRGKPE